MGHVDTTITITNAIDQARAEAGEIDEAAVRSVTLDGVLVDTGATHLSLPASLVARLGLRPLRELTMSTAAGPRPTRLLQDAVLTVLGRSSPMPVLELPEGVRPLLGVTPLEVLGLQPNMVKRRLELLPEGPTDTYVNAFVDAPIGLGAGTTNIKTE